MEYRSVARFGGGGDSRNSPVAWVFDLPIRDHINNYSGETSMLYLVAIIAPPFALLFAGKWGHAVLSAMLCALAVLGFFFFVIPGVVLTAITVLHAILVIHGRNADKRTQKVVDAIENSQAA